MPLHLPGTRSPYPARGQRTRDRRATAEEEGRRNRAEKREGSLCSDSGGDGRARSRRYLCSCSSRFRCRRRRRFRQGRSCITSTPSGSTSTSTPTAPTSRRRARRHGYSTRETSPNRGACSSICCHLGWPTRSPGSSSWSASTSSRTASALTPCKRRSHPSRSALRRPGHPRHSASSNSRTCRSATRWNSLSASSCSRPRRTTVCCWIDSSRDPMPTTMCA